MRGQGCGKSRVELGYIARAAHLEHQGSVSLEQCVEVLEEGGSRLGSSEDPVQGSVAEDFVEGFFRSVQGRRFGQVCAVLQLVGADLRVFVLGACGFDEGGGGVEA